MYSIPGNGEAHLVASLWTNCLRIHSACVVQCMQAQAWIPSCIVVSVMSHWYRKSLLDLYIFPEISMAQASLVTKDFITGVSWPEIF